MPALLVSQSQGAAASATANLVKNWDKLNVRNLGNDAPFTADFSTEQSQTA